MSEEKYIIDIGCDGSKQLTKLEVYFNPSTQAFLLASGLKEGMTVLDIGCGSGIMTAWIAEQVGQSGKVHALEHDENQLNAARKCITERGLQNVEFHLGTAYELRVLNQVFDLVYSRFVIHHLHRPSDAIQEIFRVLKSGGVYASEEGIVDYAFSYPFHRVWGSESLNETPCWVDVEGRDRDANLGMKMFHKMYTQGFNIRSTKIIHPVLCTREEKALLMIGREEYKRFYLENGVTEAEWDDLNKELERMIEDDSQIMGYYASCQVAGQKP